MTEYTSKDHPLVEATSWDPARPAEPIGDRLLMSRGSSNCYLVAGEQGDVMVNTGTPWEGAVARAHFEEALGRPLDVAAIVITQSHADHAGGWASFAGPSTRTYVQRNFPAVEADRKRLAPFYALRRDAVLHAILQSPHMAGGNFARNWKVPEAIAFTELFTDHVQFEAGGRRYELYSAPGGETTDALFVWLPDQRIAFIGNWAGALYGALPNFYTLRGDRDRSVPQFLRDLDLLISLEPDMLVTGHGEPVRGAGVVRNDLEKLRRVVAHIHDETVRGMNEGKSLSALMRGVTVPDEAQIAPGRGPASWIVRAVWEEYAGWFRHENTSELYGTPASDIWPSLCAMAGGPVALASKARAALTAGYPQRALHWIEVALAADPLNKPARETEIAILEALIERNANQHFDEICWLETRIKTARTALSEG